LRILSLAALGAALSVVVLTPAGAAEPAYLGHWKFTDAVAAPWADAQRKPDAKERARLLGKTLTVTAKGIVGPDPFKCKGAHYALKDYPADMLFQGAFGEMQSKDKSVDPGKLATALGFKGASFKTLETGCQFDFHFVDERTAEVGLNDYVYTLTKQ
jgi:hypothetical protein